MENSKNLKNDETNEYIRKASFLITNNIFNYE